MRNRSNSGVRLDFYQRMVHKVILEHQNPVTGLIPATPNHPHAWVRDNVYSVLAVWGLALAYKKNADLDEDRAKGYELEQSVVKLMRGLLFSMMTQMDKVEKFKYSQSPLDALHAKYDVTTGKTVVGDSEWGHLQVDATSLYLLILAEMTASGLQIVYTLDEVVFLQNLVFYIQAAYRTPDYGIWERGDKTNHGLPELNATSIGMAKAALEALNELDFFGARGGPSSVIHVMSDEAQQCQAILHSVLPRESNSKETDAGLLNIISYPAFAVDDQELIDLTRETVVSKLQGRYGLSRFLRDGYKTPKEDPNRLHYEPWELAVFENIECEWPMFFANLVLDGLFRHDSEQVEEYTDALEEIMLKREDGIRIMPELYAVPGDKVEAEYKDPKSQDRIPMGKTPQMWGTSIYVLGRLLKEGFLSPGELDPLNRRLVAEPKPDIVVQVVVLAEDRSIQEKLAYYDIKVQTIAELNPIQVYPARVLSHLFSHLGKSKKLGMTGRPMDVMGILATSKLYMLGDQTLAFFPQFVDQKQFYLPLDVILLLDMFKTEIQYLGANWKMLGRPLILFPVKTIMLDFSQSLHPALVSTIKKLQTGYINGTRVHLSNLGDFVNTSCMTNLTFLTEAEDSPDLANLLNYIQRIGRVRHRSGRLLGGPDGATRRRSGWQRMRRKTSVSGIIRRTCSIQIDPGELPATILEDIGQPAVEAFDLFLKHSPKAPRMLTQPWHRSRKRMRRLMSEQKLEGFAKSPYGSEINLCNPDFSHLLGPRGSRGSITSLLGPRDSFSSGVSNLGGSVSRPDSYGNLSAPREPLLGRASPRESLAREMSLGSLRESEDLTSPVSPSSTTTELSMSSGSCSPTSSIPTSPSYTAPPGSQSGPGLFQSQLSYHPHLKGSDFVEGSTIQAYHDKMYEGIDCHNLIEQLKDTESLPEQADIIHFLFVTKGPDWVTDIEGSGTCTVKDLLSELYDRAGHVKQWWLVRHTAGMLRKKVEDLARAATDVLVRQKQLAVGLPPEPREKIITRPLPPDELAAIIHEACGEDSSTAMLTQEVLVYLAMFIRTEPKLFNEMLRIRVGLIVQVMASELARTLKCSGEEASDQLLNLSPYEMKTLLHHILSGKEFGVSKGTSINSDETRLTICPLDQPKSRVSSKEVCSTFNQFRHQIKTVDELNTLPLDSSAADQLQESMDTDRQGQWLRRRRLDGALNRVPVGFYEDIWMVLKRCHGISIENHLLPQSLTREMTQGELKFALQVEMALNRIPQPEYRQLMVEAMMVLCLIVQNDSGSITWNQVIPVSKMVTTANEIFIDEQSKMDGDVTLCCGIPGQSRPNPLKCGGTAGICQNFFDTAPSGRYGTMSYLCKAAVQMLPFPTTADGSLDCVVQ